MSTPPRAPAHRPPAAGTSVRTASRPTLRSTVTSRIRAALSGLTTRGRALLSAGVAAALCAVVLGQTELLRVAVLVLALPLVSAFVVVRTRYRVASTRFVEPTRAPAGSAAQVRLRVENVSRLPTGLLLLEEEVPYVLGIQPRFVVDRVESRGVREVRYPIRSDVRGVFPIGPLTVRLSDPFGLCELPRAFASQARFVVTPVVHPLPPVSLGGEWSGRGESRSRSIAAAGEDDIATREYRHGDDLRRVHWRSTARKGELMVRREEQPWKNRATVLLDTRRIAHAGDGPSSSFEWAVSAAASIALHLVQRGYAVRLVTDAGLVVGGGHDGAGTSTELASGELTGLILDSLAVVTPSHNESVTAAAPALRRSADSLVVAVLGAVTGPELDAVTTLRSGRATAAAILLDVDAWSPGGRAVTDHTPTESATAILQQSGWRVATAQPSARLADLWSRLALADSGRAAWQAPRPATSVRSAVLA